MTTLGTIILPDDIEWTDEFKWNRTAQQREVSLGGSLMIEESAQLKGRPITLESNFNGSKGYAVINRSVLEQLYALTEAPLVTPLVLTLLDGRTFSVRFRYDSGAPAVEASTIKYKAPAISTDKYSVIIRLIEV